LGLAMTRTLGASRVSGEERLAVIRSRVPRARIMIEIRVPLALFAATVLAVLAPSDLRAGVNAWTSGGPEGGMIRSLAIDPTRSDVVYAGSLFAGVLKSTSGGNFWTTIDNGLSRQVHALAIDPNAPGTLYAGTFLGGLFKTINGGVEWAPINNGLPFPGGNAVFAITIDPKTTNTLYVGTSSGEIFKSTNRGGNWSRVFQVGASPVAALAIDPTTSTTLYAATLGAGVFKTINGGASWTAFNTGLSDLAVATVAIDSKTPSTVYAGTFGHGVFKSLNGGATWATANNGLPDVALEAVTIVVDRQTPLTVYVGTFAGGAFKSTNGGASWFAINAGLPASSLVTSFAVDPNVPTTIYAGLVGGGVFKSTNGGATWEPSNASLVASLILALAGDPQTPATLYAGTYRDKLFKSTNGGATWRSSSSGITDATINAVVVSPGSFATVYAGTSERSIFVNAIDLFGPIGDRVVGLPGPGSVFKSTDKGATWARTSLVTTAAVQTLAVASSSTVYAGTFGSGVSKSTDGGSTWSPMNTGLTDPFIFSLALDPVSPGTVYAGSSSLDGRGRVFKTTNGGVTWVATSLSAREPVVALAVAPTAPSTVYAGTYGDGVYRSVNGGATWTAVNSGLFNQASDSSITVFALAVDPNNAATVYAGSFDNGVFKSTNGGGTWARSNDGLPAGSAVHAITSNAAGTCLHAGTGGSVYNFATEASSECPPPPGLGAELLTTFVPEMGLTPIDIAARVKNLAPTEPSTRSVHDEEVAAVSGETCGITLLTDAPVRFSFQAVDPLAPINTPVSIAAGASRSFFFGLLPTEPFCRRELQFAVKCANSRLADTQTAVNTVSLAAGTQAGCGLEASAIVNQHTFTVGQTLVAGGSVTNPGLPGTTADFYVGMWRPDNFIEFLTSTGLVVVRADNLASAKPIAENVLLNDAFNVREPDLAAFRRQWAAADPRGSYLFFIAAVKRGAQLDGKITEDEILSLAPFRYSFP